MEGNQVEEENEVRSNEKMETMASVNVTKEDKPRETNEEMLDDLYVSLEEQKLLFLNEVKDIESKRESYKEKVNNLFEKVQEVLVKKKGKLLSVIDTECSAATSFLTDIISHIESDEQVVTDSRNNPEEGAGEKLKKQIDKSFEKRVDVFNKLDLPQLVLNEGCVETVKRLSLGEFQGSAVGDTYITELMNKDDCSEESETYESAPESEDYLDDGESSLNEVIISEGGTECAPGAGAEKENKQHDATAGKLNTPPRDTPMEGEEISTPYWKAMGLSKPPEVPQPPGQVENENMPDNKLQHLHSFSLHKMHGRRNLMPVAMTWNRGRICVADRANMKIGFFYPTGELITEISECTELRDLTFLDETHGETRYVLTSPKSKTLMIIGIDVENTTRMIMKFDSPHRYSYICRGPRPCTFLGAKVVSKSNKSVVHMFTMAGQILLTITNTPSYNQLQCVKGVDVFGSHIIVLDGNINSVSVYQDDGRTVGEYRGTPELPLVNPLDMTLDNKGNIMILNGEFSSIHVIDLHCNLIEIIKIPRGTTSKSSSGKLIAFDIESQRLLVTKCNGDVDIYTFKNGYDCLTQRKPDPCLALPHQNATNIWEPPQEVVPLVEGMVPSTIEDIMSKQRGRNRLRNRQFPS